MLSGNFKVIITGSTGMVGKAVLLECLESALIDEVLVINRRHVEMKHLKMKEIIHQDLSDINAIKKSMTGYDAMFHCMGVSALGLNEETYTKLTLDVTTHLADVCYDLNPEMIFNYVSGAGTDEKGRSMWARVKGKTENVLLSRGFKDAYMFRPGMILPEKGIKSGTGWYNAVYVILRPFYGVLKRSENITTSSRVGKAMINSLSHPQENKRLENPDINRLASKSSDPIPN